MALQTFEQGFYLDNNADVLTAVLNGTFTSAEEHYVLFGESEGRMPSAFFEPSGYFATNADVLSAVQSGVFSTGLQHYEEFGAAEDRTPGNIDFNETFYLETNPDVAEAVAAGTFSSGYEHYVLFGAGEGRSPAEGVAPGVPGDTLTFTTDAAENLVGTSADDTFTGIMDGTTPALSTFNGGDTADGLGGTDTFNLFIDGGAVNAPSGSSVDNIEIVNLESGVGSSFRTIAGTIEADYFDGATQITQAGGTAVPVTDVGAGVTIGFEATPLPAGGVTVADGVTSASVEVTDVPTGNTLVINETTADDVTTATVSGSVAGAGALTVDTAAGTSAVETLNLGISSDSVVTMATDATTVTVDASASTGDLGLAIGATVTSLTGGTGADALDLTAAAQTVIHFPAGSSGLTAATSDDITAFATTVDTLSFWSAAGDGTNFLDGGTSSGYTDGLTNANTAFDGTLQYFYTDAPGEGLLFVDRDLDGAADEGIQLVGLGAGGLVQGDIVA